MIKSWKLYLESYNDDVSDICNRYKINKWSINPRTGLVDVNEPVNLSFKELDKLPLNFGRILGSFYCQTNRLTTLEGCPNEVLGGFYCYDNNLTSLLGCPNIVYKDFSCYNNELTSLKGCPNIVQNFYCENNKLTSLLGGPSKTWEFCCENNKLTSLKGCPRIVKGDFSCQGNNLSSLEGLVKADSFNASFNPIVYLDEIGKTMISKKIPFLESVTQYINNISDIEFELIFRDVRPQKILDLNNFKIFNLLRTHLPQKYKEVMKLQDVDLSADLGELGF